MDVKKNIKDFYNHEAKKYYQSRNKPRADGKHILDEIKKYNKKDISILEFGCGGGRCIKYLNENLKGIKINYIGVDLSDELLSFAKKDNPKNSFVCDDIVNYIKDTNQESFDFIIGIASFQHIYTKKERKFLLKSFYRALKYGGKLIMTNRSLSKWFINRYSISITKSIVKSVYTLGGHDWKDLDIPRKNGNNTFNRFYHIFSKKELNTLFKESGFIVQELVYLDKKGEKTQNKSYGNNTLIIGEKQVFL